VALALGTPDAVLGLRSLAERLDAPTDLASLGLPADALDEVAERAVSAVGQRNPRQPDAPSLRRLLDDAYAGRPPGTY
jgi:alcohol dehydrogenase class IV